MAIGLLVAVVPMLHGQITVTTAAGASSLIGDAFDLPVVVDMTSSGLRLGSFNMTLRWDPATLQYVASSSGSFGSVTVNEDSVATGAVFFSGVNPVGAAGVVSLGIGRFQPLRSDTTTFRLSVKELFEAGTFADLLPSVTVVNRQYCPGRGRYGDVDPDGTVDSRDALIALNNAVGLNVSAFDIALADVDADGDADPRDALVMLSYAVGLDVSAFRVLVVAPGSVCATTGGTTFTLTPDTLAILPGQNVEYTLLGQDSIGSPVGVPLVSWTTSDTTVAMIDSVGVLTALAPGTAIVTARQDSAIAASTLITVTAGRSVHWVDAVAVAAVNQLGTAAFPFGDITSALAVAASGDTVKIRSGVYAEALIVDRPLVLMGDTAGGALPPVIASTGPFTTGMTITAPGPGRIVLEHLALDTIYQGVWATDADSLFIRDVDFRSVSSGFASLRVDSLTLLDIRASRFLGDVGGSFFTGNNAIYLVRSAQTVRIDSTTFSDYGDHALELFALDSLELNDNRFLNNRGYGIFYLEGDTASAAAVVMRRNDFDGNASGGFLFRFVRSVHTEHNDLYIGGGGGTNQFEGISGSVLSFRGDTLVGDAFSSNLLYLQTFDSLTLDSINVDAGAGTVTLLDGRVAVVRNSDFRNVTNRGILAQDGARHPGGRLVVRNTNIRGADTLNCNLCGSGIDGFRINIDLDSAVMFNLKRAITTNDSVMVVQRAGIDHVVTGLQLSCGSGVIGNTTVTRGTRGINYTGCRSGDSLAVDASVFGSVQYGIQSRWGVVTLTNSTIQDVSYGLFHTDSSLTATANQVVNASIYGLYVDINGITSSTTVLSGNNVSCNPVGSQSGRGMYVLGGNATVTGDTVMGCWYGIDYQDFISPIGTPGLVRNNYIVASNANGSIGINNNSTRQMLRIVGNTVTGPAMTTGIAAGYNAGSSAPPRIEIDSNLVDGVVRTGILGYSADTLLIRDNQVLNLGATTCCTTGAGGNGAIVLSRSTAASRVAEVRRNRITDSKSNGIIVARDFNDSVLVLVDSNTVKRVDSIGIWVDDYSNALLQFNAIDSARSDAVRTSRFAPTNLVRDTVFIQNNNFTNSGGFGVNNLTASDSVLAAGNWWNDAGGPSGSFGNRVSLGDSVSANVTWFPPLSAPASAPVPSAPGFPAVMFEPSGIGRSVRSRIPGLGPPVPMVGDRAPGSRSPPMFRERRPRAVPPNADPAFRSILEQDRLAEALRRRLFEARTAQWEAIRRREAEAERIRQTLREPSPGGAP